MFVERKAQIRGTSYFSYQSRGAWDEINTPIMDEIGFGLQTTALSLLQVAVTTTSFGPSPTDRRMDGGTRMALDQKNTGLARDTI